jgi:hypothetical protein
MTDSVTPEELCKAFLVRHYDAAKRRFIRPDETACKRVADWLEGGGEDPEAWMIRYAVAKLRADTVVDRMGQRGGDPRKNTARNVIIGQMVLFLSNQLRLKPTRNLASEGECASSIVTRLLKEVDVHLTEKSVAEIWGEVSKELELVPDE